MLNPTTSNIPLVTLPGASMESAADTSLCDSNRPQRSAAIRAAEKIALAADSPTDDDALKKKKSPAAFQLSAKVIPDDAGHIKVSSP
jgi:hypothetical protein